jgi:hypothetical protein
MRGVKKSREASIARADGVVLVKRMDGLWNQRESFLDQHHPVRSIKGGCAIFFDVAATPPQLRRGIFRVTTRCSQEFD